MAAQPVLRNHDFKMYAITFELKDETKTVQRLARNEQHARNSFLHSLAPREWPFEEVKVVRIEEVKP